MKRPSVLNGNVFPIFNLLLIFFLKILHSWVQLSPKTNFISDSSPSPCSIHGL